MTISGLPKANQVIYHENSLARSEKTIILTSPAQMFLTRVYLSANYSFKLIVIKMLIMYCFVANKLGFHMRPIVTFSVEN